MESPVAAFFDHHGRSLWQCRSDFLPETAVRSHQHAIQRPGIRSSAGTTKVFRYFFLDATMADPTAKPKVLIADDERIIADTLAMILNQGGFEAQAVYSCVKALEMAPAFKPDLLISDVIMSELNGIEAAIRMKALLPDIRVFLLSGQTATAEMLEQENAAGYGFEVLTKPFQPKDLIRKLRDTMDAKAVPPASLLPSVVPSE